jgi:hypothetical protein
MCDEPGVDVKDDVDRGMMGTAVAVDVAADDDGCNGVEVAEGIDRERGVLLSEATVVVGAAWKCSRAGDCTL